MRRPATGVLASRAVGLNHARCRGMLYVDHHARTQSSGRLHGASTLAAAALSLGLTFTPRAAAAQIICPASAPVSCPGGSCAATARECAAVEGCPPNMPHRCSNGACAQTDASCTSAKAPAEPNARPALQPATNTAARGQTAAEAADLAAADATAAAAAAESAALDAYDAAADAEVAADDVEVAASDAEQTASDLESRQSPTASFGDEDANNCPTDTPVDCRDGTCASSVYACRETVPVSEASLSEDASDASFASPGVDGVEDGNEAMAEGCAAGAPDAAGASAAAVAMVAYVASRLRRRRTRPLTA